METNLSSRIEDMLDARKARDIENELLGENSSDVAEAFRAITSMVVE